MKTYRFENVELVFPGSAKALLIAINGEVADMHKRGFDLNNITICSHEEDDGYVRAHMEFRKEEEVA